jgi:hypothetical protein
MTGCGAVQIEFEMGWSPEAVPVMECSRTRGRHKEGRRTYGIKKKT